MLSKLWGIVHNSYTETIRQPIYGVIILATFFMLILNLSLAAYTLDDDNKFNKDLGLSTLLMSGLFLSAFSAAGVLSREIENKTVLTVISKPVSRPLFLVGKFIGLAGALATAFFMCAAVYLLTMRHGVMSTARDQYDLPVLLFGFGAVAGTLLLAVFCNYFYDMQFSSTATFLGVPMLAIALALVGLISPKWYLQPFGQDFVDGQLVGALALVFAMVMILTAVAVAVSTRLGQVMTLTICTAVLLMGLVSDTMFGMHSDTSVWARIAYWVSPNLAFLWVTDALTQDKHITMKYISMAFAYASLLIAAWLAIGVAMFQKREVG